VCRATNDAAQFLFSTGLKQKKSSPSVALSFMFEASLMTKLHHFETMW